MHRSTTDLTTNLVIDDSLFHHCSVELSKHPISIVEVHAKVMETKLLLVLVLTNHRIIVYEGLTDFPDYKTQAFRFKIVQNQVLRRRLPAEGEFPPLRE